MAKTNIDFHSLRQMIQTIGDSFRAEFRRQAIPANAEETWSLFREIEARSTKQLTDRLKIDYPNIPFADGELDLERQQNAWSVPEYWIFDSMDGAVQYMRHLPGWSFNLVLIQDGELSWSVIYDPLHDEMYWAEKGGGAFLNGQRLTCPPASAERIMMAGTSHPPFPNRHAGLVQRVGDCGNRLLEAYSFVRNLGPTALQLAYVAAGRLDVFAEEGMDTFNWLPGVLIANEAGADVLRTDGQAWRWGDDNILVAAPGMAKLYSEKRKG